MLGDETVDGSSKSPTDSRVLERWPFGDSAGLVEEDLIAHVDAKQHVNIGGNVERRVSEETISRNARLKNVRLSLRKIAGNSRKN